MNEDYKYGDWQCFDCGFNNFASRQSCKECGRYKKVNSQRKERK